MGVGRSTIVEAQLIFVYACYNVLITNEPTLISFFCEYAESPIINLHIPMSVELAWDNINMSAVLKHERSMNVLVQLIQ